jgi:hypothetical protein
LIIRSQKMAGNTFRKICRARPQRYGGFLNRANL